jgi:hypothetical protein
LPVEKDAWPGFRDRLFRFVSDWCIDVVLHRSPGAEIQCDCG